jgi:hypothetical protein
MSLHRGVRALAAIAEREVRQRAALVGMAALVAIVPFVGPSIGIGDRPLLHQLLGVLTVLAVAVLTGSGAIPGDLADGRVGFFFARPVPWWSIWGGKLLAAIVLTFVAGALVLGPALGHDLPLSAPWWWVARDLGPAVGVPSVIALIAIVTAMAVGYRSRRAWFALDFALANVLGWIALRTTLGLRPWGVLPSRASITLGVWAVALALIVASAAAVAQGRADIRRAHRTLSLVAWTLLIPIVLAYAGWGTWVKRFSPADLGALDGAWIAPGSSWVAGFGRLRAPRPSSMRGAVLLDTRSGRFLRVGPGLAVATFAVSPDGSRGAWVAFDAWAAFEGRGSPALRVADLTAGAPSASAAPLPVPPSPLYGLALSPGGREAVALQSTQATLFTIGSSQATVVVPARFFGPREVVFAPDGRAHVASLAQDWNQPGFVDLLVLDPATRRAAVTGRAATRGSPVERWSAAADRVAIVHHPEHGPSATLHDGGTGALLATLVPEGARVGHVSVGFLHDGRIAAVEGRDRVVLHVFTRDGAETLALEIAPFFAHARVAEVGAGVLAVDLPYRGPLARDSDLVLVDVSGARVIRREKGLALAGRPWFAPAAGDTLFPGLFIDDRGALVRLDIATGARQRLLGGE